MLWQSVSSSKHFQGKYIFKGVTTAKAQTAARTMTYSPKTNSVALLSFSDSRLAAASELRKLIDEED